MNVCELRASTLESLGVTITEEPFEEFGEQETKTVITAPRALMPALTNWLDVTNTGRLVELTFTD
jgi:hypothetical protein